VKRKPTSSVFPSRPRCEGYKKPGSFMTLGPRYWQQCENPATMLVRFKEEYVKGIVANKKVWCCDECYSEFKRIQPETKHTVSNRRAA
jgi:hypothetical protein